MAEKLLRSVHDAVNREYDYIIVGAYLFRSHPTSLLEESNPYNRWRCKCPPLLPLMALAHIRRPQGLSSPHAYQRIPPSPCSFSKPDVPISTMILSVRVPSAILPLTPPLTMRVAMPGTFGKNFFQLDYEWGVMTVGTGISHEMRS
jgi:hypothetical protein